MSARTCLIFFPDGYIGVAPTIKNLAEILAEDGYDVRIVGWRTPYPSPTNLHPNVKLLAYRRPWDLPIAGLVERGLRRIGFTPVVTVVELAWLFVRSLSRIATAYRGSPPSFILGIDTIGSMLAAVMGALTHRPYAYLSLELPARGRGLVLPAFLHRLEAAAVRRACFVVIQDTDRLTTLTDYLGVDLPSPILLPNAPRGSVGRVAKGMNLLRERLGIPPHEFPTLVLQAGMIEDSTYSFELAAAFAGVGSGCALVLHERVRRNRLDPYLRTLSRANSQNLFLSLDPVDIDEVDAVFASAAVGLAFYRDLGPNFGQIAMASGKLAYYMKHGVPIIANDLPSLARFVADHHVGVIVKSPPDTEDLARALDIINQNYDAFSRNARRAFVELFDFDRKSEAVIERIRDAADRRRLDPQMTSAKVRSTRRK